MDPCFFFCSEMGTRRSSGKLETIIVENAKDEMGKWITLRVSIGSWVTLQPSRNRIWAKKRRLDDLKCHWKEV
jgi:undecaprenyl pyrophosphate synthase